MVLGNEFDWFYFPPMFENLMKTDTYLYYKGKRIDIVFEFSMW